MLTPELHETAKRLAPRVQKIARGLARRLPSSVDVDDLIQAGYVGMMTALEAYEPERKADLDSYVERRVRGAMLDDLRALDPLSRDQRRDARAIDAATRSLENVTGSAAEADVAARAGLSVDRVREVRERALAVRFEMLDGERCDASVVDPIEMLSFEELRQQLAAGIEGLPERQRQILALHYTEELSLKEIGRILGVTESRVCQIIGEAQKCLRVALPH
jgi:RNA polymerase sigma factor for flagellar operon FliA